MIDILTRKDGELRMKKIIIVLTAFIVMTVFAGCSINVSIGDKEKEYVGTELEFSYYGNSSMDGSKKRTYEWDNEDGYEYFIITVHKNNGKTIDEKTTLTSYEVGYGTTVTKVMGYKQAE